jgi:hypothetical protein
VRSKQADDGIIMLSELGGEEVADITPAAA